MPRAMDTIVRGCFLLRRGIHPVPEVSANDGWVNDGA
jgi:hypothetical protein